LQLITTYSHILYQKCSPASPLYSLFSASEGLWVGVSVLIHCSLRCE